MPVIPGSAGKLLAQLIHASDVYPRPLDLFNWSLRYLSARQAEGGQYFTPAEVTRLMVGAADPGDGHRVLDPACGSAGLLVAASRHVEQRLGPQAAVRVTGRDYLAEVLSVARMNVAVHQLEANLVRGDSLQRPEEVGYDIVLANPPFNTPAWTEQARHDDPRWRDTPPPRSRADFAWLLHCAHALAPQGRGAVLMPNTAASRKIAHIEKDIRRRLVDDDLIEAVIALPPRLLKHVKNACSLWLLNRDKSTHTGQTDRRGRVLFIDATRHYKAIPNSRDRRLPEEAVELILATVSEWRTGESADRIGAGGWSAVASVEQIADRDFDLLPTRYVDPGQAEETSALIADLTAELQGCFEESRLLEQRLLDMLESW